MTDFDVKDDAVGICKAVMNGVAPGVQIIDITHQATPYDIAEGARFLAGSSPYFPKDAVFVVVIDPTVGSTRRAIIAHSRTGQYFVLPDNGLLTLIQDRDGIEGVRQITNPEWMIGAKTSSTFHGRDIFSPAGAHLARGDDWTKAGPAVEVASLVRLNLRSAVVDASGLHGEVIGTDGPFGNLVLNVPSETFARLGYHLGDTVPVQVGDHLYQLPFVKTFSDVAVGKPLAYIDSRGRLSLGINQNSFADTYGVRASTQSRLLRRDDAACREVVWVSLTVTHTIGSDPSAVWPRAWLRRQLVWLHAWIRLLRVWLLRQPALLRASPRRQPACLHERLPAPAPSRLESPAAHLPA
ncbi:SAM hydrolase/SAM-dependent halogenase family protein [Tunturiibacter gelidiferens]|uniref:SAM hydrolase/SAM-dependent halogenase family protein n=1 Tax=Tunturiibacter gelidiferens TaxID=3069689 RepID=UPI003D9B6867